MNHYDFISDKVNTCFDDECWLWPEVRPDGYGKPVSNLKGKIKHPHQIAYTIRYGDVPDGKNLDHLCRNRPCWNPRHLEPVTNRENTLRGDTYSSGWRRNITHCPQGHEYTPENTYFKQSANQGRGCRQCRTCAYNHNLKSRVKS